MQFWQSERNNYFMPGDSAKRKLLMIFILYFLSVQISLGSRSTTVLSRSFLTYYSTLHNEKDKYLTKVRDCRISKYKINCEILRFWYYHDILILLNVLWYIFHIPHHGDILRIWHYHDILIYQMIFDTSLPSNGDTLILSWYFEI